MNAARDRLSADTSGIAVKEAKAAERAPQHVQVSSAHGFTYGHTTRTQLTPQQKRLMEVDAPAAYYMPNRNLLAHRAPWAATRVCAASINHLKLGDAASSPKCAAPESPPTVTLDHWNSQGSENGTSSSSPSTKSKSDTPKKIAKKPRVPRDASKYRWLSMMPKVEKMCGAANISVIN